MISNMKNKNIRPARPDDAARLAEIEIFNYRLNFYPIFRTNDYFFRELTVPVLDGRCLCPIEIVPPEGSSFDYVAKYQSGSEGARELCPAPITEAERELLSEAALKLHRALGLAVYSRADFLLDREGRAWCLEVNTLPGMTPASLIPKAAAEAGISYGELCEQIVLLSIAERSKKN